MTRLLPVFAAAGTAFLVSCTSAEKDPDSTGSYRVWPFTSYFSSRDTLPASEATFLFEK